MHILKIYFRGPEITGNDLTIETNERHFIRSSEAFEKTLKWLKKFSFKTGRNVGADLRVDENGNWTVNFFLVRLLETTRDIDPVKISYDQFVLIPDEVIESWHTLDQIWEYVRASKN